MENERLIDIAYKKSLGFKTDFDIEYIKIASYTHEEIKKEINKINVSCEELCDYLCGKLNISYDNHIINPYSVKGIIEVFKLIKKENK